MMLVMTGYLPVSGDVEERIGGWRFRNSAGVMKGLFTIDDKKYLGPERHHGAAGSRLVIITTTSVQMVP